MTTDYILFIHGVNTRQQRESQGYSQTLFDLLQQQAHNQNSGLKLERVELYWGDVNQGPEKLLRQDLENSETWDKIWFKDFRLNQLLQFAGDAALYISRYIGSKVVNTLWEQIDKGLKNYQQNDRLHLVTHSWGTVILFDILFASRWDDPSIPGHENVQRIREFIFGIKPNPFEGIKIGSLHTMGSPISIFSLMDVDETTVEHPTNTHDITPRFQSFLQTQAEAQDRRPLPWLNFVHPGDPIAYPISTTLRRLVDGESQFLHIKDEITHDASLFDFLTEPVSQTVLALLHGGDAHGSYWKSREVAQKIIETIYKYQN